MGTVTGQLTSLPGRYARALFSLAQSEGAIEEIFDSLNTFEKQISTHQDLKQALTAPLFAEQDRLAVLQAVLKKNKST